MTTRPYKIPESVLVVIHSADLQVLLIERADWPGFWQSVTGAKDRLDEPFDEVAVREVAEETGIVVGSPRVPREALRNWGLRNVYPIHPHYRPRYAPDVASNTEHVYGLTVPRDIEVTLAPREHVRYEWLPWQEAAQKCLSAPNAEAILHLPRFVA